MRRLTVAAAVPLLALLAYPWMPAGAPSTLAELRDAFQHPPDEARMMVRWWWFGPAVQNPELEREMRLMKEGGIGGFEVQPVYPLELEGNTPYLSDEFLDALRFTGAKARELGLRFDLTLGSGWPYGGPHISLDLAAPRLRIQRGATIPALGEGEKLIAAFPDQGVYFVESHTRMMVKRAAAGAEGFVLNHYDRAAIGAHLKSVGDRLAQAFGVNPPYAIFSDSLEVERSDWTAGFLAEFRKRRGYDLMPYLPALAGDMGEKTMSVRHDWGQTLTELANDNYLTPLRDWAHQHATLLRSQTYGTPPVELSSNALVDLPEGEGTQWRRFSTTRWASSASHLYGKPVTSSETWTWLHSPVFRATPLDMKAEADLHFLQGINQLIGHGWPYSPPSAGEPGYRFYAAAVFNEHNPWWMVMPDIARYLQRISFLLRQGQPANDVGVYIPTDDAWAAFTPGSVSVNKTVETLLGTDLIPRILDSGYNFDFIDDAAVAKLGVPYRILILPAVERIPFATYRRLEEYVRKGGTLIATRRTPSIAPGLMDAADTGKIAALSQTLFEGGSAKLVTDLATLPEIMHRAVAPDVAVAPEIGFVHRKLPFADIYFLANTSNHAVHSSANFRVGEMASSSWDPLTGNTTNSGGSHVDLTLAPYESRVMVFARERAAPLPGWTPYPPLTGAAGNRTETAPLPPPIELNENWTIAFGGSEPVKLDQLATWSDQYYSGRATYETVVAVPSSMTGGQRPVFLNFGEGTPVTVAERNAGSGMRAMLEAPVREAAIVSINGQPAGSVWCAPYELEVSSLLKPGDNRVRIVVANLAINAMAKGPLPDYKALNAKYGERFQPQDMANVKPQPSGILAPVRLIAR